MSALKQPDPASDLQDLAPSIGLNKKAVPEESHGLEQCATSARLARPPQRKFGRPDIDARLFPERRRSRDGQEVFPEASPRLPAKGD